MWTSWSSTRPSARFRTWVRLIPSTNTGCAESGLRAALRRRTLGYWLTRSSLWHSNVCSQSRRPAVPWAASKAAWPAGQVRCVCPFTLLWSPASSSGALSTGETWICCSRFRAGPQEQSKGWSTSTMRKRWESWSCSAWRRESSGDML